MNRLLNQFILGMWGAMALGFGVMSRSWSTGLSLAAVGLYFAVGTWSCSAVKHHLPLVRRVARVLSTVFFGVFILAGAFTAERLYFVNGPSYPAWLATRDLGTLTEAQLMAFATGNECRGGSEVMHKAAGLVVIRCGGFMRYEAPTYIAHRQGEHQ